jgi:hypothetical protein
MKNTFTLVMESIINRNRYRLTDKTKDWLILIACSFCLFLFLSAAYSKVTEHDIFLKGLSKAPVVGGFAFYIAWLVPATELIVAVLLIIPQTCKWGLYGFITLMALFTVYVTSMVLWAVKVPCHCNVIIEKLSWTQHIWFNLAFIALALFALRLLKTKIN